ncbi:hypothetical protein JTB14_033021 [Gonioctena quinquepunctata]|nr:hypothetical protein JTB14_033021 [Gonioctena quinquepunctata]
MNIQSQYKLPSSSPIYPAEAYVIVMALVHILIGCKNFVICSDSHAVLTSIQNKYNPTASLNQFVIRIKINLYNLKISDGNNAFIWVKVHTGIELNEKVDTLAEETVNLTTLATTQIFLDDLIAADKVV